MVVSHKETADKNVCRHLLHSPTHRAVFFSRHETNIGSLRVDGAERIYAHLLFVATLALKADDTIYGCKQSVILATAHIVAWMDLRAALAHEDIARQYKLAVCALGAEALRFAVPSVAGGAHSLFVGEHLQIHAKHFFLHFHMQL